MIRACAGVEVIPRGPPVGDHMANVRVEIALREVKRCAEHSGFQLNNRQMYASADDCPLLSWLPRIEMENE